MMVTMKPRSMFIRRAVWPGLFALLLASPLSAQERGAVIPTGKQSTAVLVPDGTIHVDGRLDEDAWQRAVSITDFVQKEPTEGAPPTDQMDVRFVYDQGALYVGARMYSHGPAAVQAPMGRRDRIEQAEHILVSLDTFLDHRTAYAFGVTAAGVRLDRFYPGDDERTFDEGYNPVWEARAAILEDGWTAELAIPFSQLRFNERPEHVWGLNIQRVSPTLNEEVYWAVVPRTEKGWASHFGELRGIRGLRTVRQLEVLPYVAGTTIVHGGDATGNPFQQGQDLLTRVGVDVKKGFGPNLTLDVTVNPDFGQVEGDPAEVNLTAFQTRFAEKRPFFTEGSQLLTIAHQNVFYSRRVGARPSGPASGEYVDYPSGSTILAAGKLTGRLRSGTSLGMLSAVTDEEFATVSNGSLPTTSVRVAPRTFYGLAHVQQEFGPSASTASAIVAFVNRDMPEGDPLAAVLSRRLVVAGGDAFLRFKGGEYEATLAGVGSFVTGDAGAITRIQRSSAHYMQRPDNNYAEVDPTRTSLAGYSVITGLRRTGGRHWLWSINSKIDSPEFETNDLAVLNAADSITPNLELRYRETRPNSIFRAYSISATQRSEWSYGGDRGRTSLTPALALTWHNYWTTSFSVTRNERAQSLSLTRGGPLMGIPGGWSSDVSVGNNVAVRTRWSGRVTVGADEDGGYTRRVNGSFAVRPGSRWQLTVTPTFEHQVYTQQYLTTLNGGRLETFGSRYIFAHTNRRTYSSQFRTTFTFAPDVDLDLYAEPFVSSGRFENHGELLLPGDRHLLTYGSSGTTVVLRPDGSRIVETPEGRFTLKNSDFNVRSFRSNVVLRWEWRPGSTLYFVWQQDRYSSEAMSEPVRLGDLFRSLTAPGQNYFVVKTSFWLPR